VQVNPLASGPAIEARPLGTPGAAAEGNSQPPATAIAPPGTPGGNGAAARGKLKTEPKALKLPYTEQNLALIQRTDAANAVKPDSAPSASPAVVAPVPAPAPGAAPVTPPKAEAKADTPAAPDEGLDWMWPASGKLVSKYAEGGNKGVDIGGRIGEPVYAAAAGKVMYSGSGVRGYGNLVIIKHNEKYLSAYAHNKSILVKEGQSVKRGQKIAELGDSGTDSAKLHFEIRRFGKPIDPLQFLPDRPGG
jgi:lipoprotein NlpD